MRPDVLLYNMACATLTKEAVSALSVMQELMPDMSLTLPAALAGGVGALSAPKGGRRLGGILGAATGGLGAHLGGELLGGAAARAAGHVGTREALTEAMMNAKPGPINEALQHLHGKLPPEMASRISPGLPKGLEELMNTPDDGSFASRFKRMATTALADRAAGAVPPQLHNLASEMMPSPVTAGSVADLTRGIGRGVGGLAGAGLSGHLAGNLPGDPEEHRGGGMHPRQMEELRRMFLQHAQQRMLPHGGGGMGMLPHGGA